MADLSKLSNQELLALSVNSNQISDSKVTQQGQINKQAGVDLGSLSNEDLMGLSKQHGIIPQKSVTVYDPEVRQLADELETQKQKGEVSTPTAMLAGYGKEATFGNLPEVQAIAEHAITPKPFEKGGELDPMQEEMLALEGLQTMGGGKSRTPDITKMSPSEIISLSKTHSGPEIEQMLVDADFTKPETIKETAKENLERDKLIQSQNPIAYGTGQLAGVVSQVGLTAPLAPTQGASFIKRAVQSGAIGAGFGLITKPEEGGSRTFQGIIGSIIGPAFEGASQTPKLAKMAFMKLPQAVRTKMIDFAKKTAAFPGRVGQKTLSVLFGVKPEVIGKYVDGFERINQSVDKEDLLVNLDTIVQSLKNDVDVGKITMKDGKRAIQALKSEIKTDMKASNQILDDAFSETKRQLKTDASLADISDDVYDSIGTLKRKVIAGSGAASEMLEGASTVKTQELKDVVQMIKGDIGTKTKTGGKVLFSDEDVQAAVSIQKYAERLNQFGDELTYPELKGIVKSLDKDINTLVNQNDFQNAKDGAAAKLRREISELLKDAVPEYKHAMKDVAENAQLLSEINKFAKTPERLRSTMSRINSPLSKDKKLSIQKLGDKLNIDYNEALERSSKIQKMLKSPGELRKLKSGLKEAKTLEKIRKTGGHKLTVTENNLKVADSKLKDALETFNSVKALNNAPNRTITSIRNKNKKALQAISKLKDKDFVQMVDDAFVLDQFTKHAERGSKNVNLFTILFGAIGALGGGGFNPATMALGAGLGAAVDRFGPNITKKIIDNVIRLKSIPSPGIIRKMKIPKNAQNWLIDQLPKGITTAVTGE